MGYASLTQHLDATPSTVWDYIVDPDHLTSWLTLFDDAESDDDRLDHEGAGFRAGLHLGGERIGSTWTITKAEEPRLIHLEGSDEHDGDIEVWIEIGAWQGGCEFEFDVSYELGGGLVNSIADRVVVERRVARELKRSIEELRSQLSAG